MSGWQWRNSLGLTLTPHPLPSLPSLQVVVNAGCAELLAMQAEVHVRSEVPPKDNSAPIKKVPPMATATILRVLNSTHSTTGTLGTYRYRQVVAEGGYLEHDLEGGAPRTGVSCGVDFGAQVVGSTWKKIVNDPAKDVLVALLSEGLFCVTCDDFVDSVWTRVAEKLEECGFADRCSDPPLPSHTRMVEPIQTR